ncbi:MAG: type II toxin-antitoxin system HicB family antitoxin [Ktedonobacteraceae bacterium]
MNIQWSNRDNVYIVSVPELPGCRTHGETYKEAVDNGIEAIEAWIEDALKDGAPIPKPQVAA